MRILKWPGYILSFALACGSMQAVSAVSYEQWRELNQNLVQEHVMPRYQSLAEESVLLEQSTKQLCSSPDQPKLDSAKKQYQAALASWQAIQHVQFGPIELLMRSFSLQFWPDKKNLTSKQLNKLLAAEDKTTLEDEFFQSASIAVKGFPAMERLLFADNAVQPLKDFPFRCQFLHSISQYVAETTANTSNEWQEYQKEFDYLSSEDGYYASSKEASVDLMKAQVEPLEILIDLKLQRPLGKKKTKAKRLESWRSLHSLENVKINLSSLHHMYSGVSGINLKKILEDQGAVDRAVAIEEQFVALETVLSDIPTPLYEHIYEPEVKEQLQLVIQGLGILHESLGKSMGLLGLQLGFNSRDGD